MIRGSPVRMSCGVGGWVERYKKGVEDITFKKKFPLKLFSFVTTNPKKYFHLFI